MSSIAIIPARSGSKGVPDKNIKLLNGKPLIAYTIEAAKASGVFDEIMVSTDSPEYAEIAEKYGAEVPFLRSNENAVDTANTWDTVEEVLRKYEELGKEFDDFCLLQPTSPLRTAEDIIKAYLEFNSKNAVAVVSVCECEHSPLWCNTLDDSMELKEFIRPQNYFQRQKLKKFYRINGAIYIVNRREFMKNQFIYRDGSFAYIMSNERSVDIDSLLDFKVAEAIILGGGYSEYLSIRKYNSNIFVRRCA